MSIPNCHSSATVCLYREFTVIQEHGLEGCSVELEKADCLQRWRVGIYGAPGTLFEGGYFKLMILFPSNYPYAPPEFRFSTTLYHPNISMGGEVAIASLLHPVTSDSENIGRTNWNPTVTASTVLLSVISMLSSPDMAPCMIMNADAAFLYREWIASYKQNKCYEEIVQNYVAASQVAAAREGIHVPTSLREYVKINWSSYPIRDAVPDLDVFYDGFNSDECGGSDSDDGEKDDEDEEPYEDSVNGGELENEISNEIAPSVEQCDQPCTKKRDPLEDSWELLELNSLGEEDDDTTWEVI